MSKNIKKSRTSKKNQIPSQLKLTHTQTISGPLPPPASLAEYERILPGLADRIVVMAEEEGVHRRELEKQIVKLTAAEKKKGQNYGLIIAIVGITASVILGIKGAEMTASVVGGSTVASLVIAFVTGKVVKSRDDE